MTKPALRRFKFLPLTLNLETQGGIATPLVRRGTPLPTERRQTFTTAADNQASVEVRIVFGESPLVAKNVPLARALLTNIPPAPRGQPQIEVIFSVDENCAVKVSAQLNGSDLRVTETTKADAVPPDADISRLIETAQRDATADRGVAKRIELRLSAESLIERADKEIRTRRVQGSDNAQLSVLDEAVSALGVALSRDDVTDIEKATTALNKAMDAVVRQSANFNFDDVFESFFQRTSPPRRRGPTVTRTRPVEPVSRPATQGPTSNSVTPNIDKARVFVVHGRNETLRKDFFSFLRAIGLRPLEWSEAVALTGSGTPYVGQILDAAFNAAQAVIVLLSPDDEARLVEALWRDNDSDFERRLTGQPRPNVLFEAGMAIGRDERRTLIVEVGKIRPISDIAGRHIIRLDNSTHRRTDVAERLRTAGCQVSTTGRDWLSIGDFGP